MDAEDEAECVPFAVPGLEDLEPGCEEDVIAAVAGLNKSRAPLPMEQLVVLYTKATKKHCAGVAKALCDVFCKYFKSHRKVYAQFGLAQVVAESVEDMVQSTDNSKKALEKALWLLVKFCQSGVRLIMKTEVLRNVLENTVSRVSSGDCGVVKNALFLVASVCGEDTSEFEEIFCRIADTAMDADSPQPEFAKEYFRAVSLDKSITNALFGKLVHLFLKPSYDLKNKTRALKALHRILNANSAFVYTLDDDDDVIDALTEVARGTFAEVAQHSLPSSSEVKVLNMLLSLIAKLRTKVPLLLEVEPRGPRVSVNAKEPAFDERDLFPELHVNVKGSADYTSDYKKCHCSSKCSCESVCFCGCTECQRPPVLEKKDLYTELVSTKDGQHDEHSGTDTGAAAHAFAQLKSPLLKVFDEDEQFERIIASISTDSELGTEWENVNDGKALSFAADFESGNLQSAKRVGEYDYELVLSPDTGTGGNAQWFYFSMTGMAPKENYNFKIVNMEKSRTLFK